VGELIAKLNQESLPGILDAKWQDEILKTPNPQTDPTKHYFNILYHPQNTTTVQVESFAKNIDVATGGSYANYNWELFFHIPLTIAVHLSKNQRFAEAQRWFHYIFDPTSYGTTDSPRKRIWKFLAFWQEPPNLLALLSKPNDECTDAERELKKTILSGYDA